VSVVECVRCCAALVGEILRRACRIALSCGVLEWAAVVFGGCPFSTSRYPSSIHATH
jgi:hypothetical protein